MKERFATWCSLLLLVLFSSSACLPDHQSPAAVEVDTRAVGDRGTLSTRLNAGSERPSPVVANERSNRELVAGPWQDILGQVHGREYSLVYDEPDNSLLLDRSEITRGLLFVHPLEIASVSASSLFATTDTATGPDSWFDRLVRGATEIHVAPGGEEGRRVARICSSLPNLSARRKVLHVYAMRGSSIGRCSQGGEGQGEDGGVCSGAEGQPGWEVLHTPRGFSHLDIGIDEPLARILKSTLYGDFHS
jgi:hypothetical protein